MRELPQVKISTTCPVDSITTLACHVDDYISGRIPVPTQVELDEMETQARCIRETLLHEFHNKNNATLIEMAKYITTGGVRKENIESLIRLLQDLDRLGDVEDDILKIARIKWM